MTPGAQQALRRIMEIYSDSTRFALACNDSKQIIEPIQSRCAVIRFRSLTNEEILKCMLSIIKKENVQYVDDGLQAIINNSLGDMRQVLYLKFSTRLILFENQFNVSLLRLSNCMFKIVISAKIKRMLNFSNNLFKSIFSKIS